MTQINEISHSDLEHNEEVFQQSVLAKNYLKSFKWCKEIVNGWLAYGFGKILCVFFFEIEPANNSGADDKIWVIVGDIPPAYLDFVGYPSAKEALDFYCYLMEEWVDCVNNGKSVDDCYPVNAPATKEYADMLQTRINIIKEDFLPLV